MRDLASRSGEVLKRQRMDFLLLLGDGSRVVIEVDGKQHYAVGDTATPRLYGEMVAEDRRLRLAGYEIYRFGGYELRDGPEAEQLVRDFFDALLSRHESRPAAVPSDAA
jgi:very-short-patch-repair endonuclease